MFSIEMTEQFAHRFSMLRDQKAKAKIAVRLDRLALGHFGDVSPVRSGVSELRLDFGPGYRLNVCRKGLKAIVLLCAGDKSTQRMDIKLALRLAKSLED